MSRSFGAGLPHMIAIAAQMLGWRPDEFWRATPTELLQSLADPTKQQGQLIGLEDIQHLLEREDDRQSD